MTGTVIIEKVKDLLEANIDGINEPVWDNDMFGQWYQDALNNFILKASNDLLSDLYTTSTTITDTTKHDLDVDFLKLILVKRVESYCFIKEIEHSRNTLYNATVDFPTCHIIGKKIYVEPAAPTAATTVIYVHQPNGNVTIECELPLDWQHLLENYICAKALEKDKQVDKASYHFNQFDQGIMIINNEKLIENKAKKE